MTLIALAPAVAFAQAELTGVVRDTSGGVLPGVTVEAASPALIEKVRTITTDANGVYRIVDLRPGAYSVTFTIAGFNTFKREGVELSGSATVVVNAELRVGAVEETVTVTGEAPIVDVQSVTRQQVLSHEVLDKIPTGRNYYSFGVLIPGVTSNGTDVGGAAGDTQAQLSIHGSRASSQRVTQNGVSVSGLAGTGGFGGTTPNVGSVAEMTVDTNAVSAEMAQGGVRINFIPRDGGNDFSASVFFNVAHENFLVSDNYTQRLQDLGLSAPGGIEKNWDFAPSGGGPIKRDRLWFYFSARRLGAQQYAPGMYYNLNAFDPTKWTYEPDLARPALATDARWPSQRLRLTWQASPRNKVSFEWDQESFCRCPNGVSATVSPEAGRDRRAPLQRINTLEWNSPVTNKLLLEAVALYRATSLGESHLQPAGSLTDPAAIAAYPEMISVLEQSTGVRYRSALTNAQGQFNRGFNANSFVRAAVSYITGSHALKAGFNNIHGYFNQRSYDFQPTSYRFNRGVPNQIQLRATPFTDSANEDADFGLFVQDRWTRSRLTMTAGLRLDVFKTSFPEKELEPGPLVPNRHITFPAQDNLDWKDLTPRLGGSFDLFGNGKTALKASLNKYLEGQALAVNSLAGAPSPFRTLVLNTTRSWNDADHDFVPDCDLLTPTANGECGPLANQNFGGTSPGAQFDPDLLTGWGHRFANWEFSTSVVHELMPRVSLEVGYFRRWFNNFQVTDNLAVAREDFGAFTVVAPADARLPGGGGYTLDGLYNVNPNKFGQSLEYNSLSDKYGKQTEHWNGVDVSTNVRLRSGLVVSGGLSTGKRTTDNCEIVAKVPELLAGLPERWCHQEEPFLTQLKGFASYVIPKIDVQLAGTFQSLPGPNILANYVATSASVAASLGRPLSGGAANTTVSIVEPLTMYGERLNQLDLRFGKVLRFGRTRSTVSLDLYNALNKDTVLTQNDNYASWQTPQSIIQARFAKISVQLDF